MVMAVPRPINIVKAASSLRDPVLGAIGHAISTIPVERQIDIPKLKGPGFIFNNFENKRILGKNTKFTELNPGTIIYITGLPELKITSIISDTELEITPTDFDSIEMEASKFSYEFIVRANYDSFYKEV